MHQKVVATLVLFAALGHFNRVGISVAGSEIFIAQYGLSEVQMGWVYTAFLLSYTILMLPGGWLIDRVGSVKAMTVYGIGMGLCVALTGGLSAIGLSLTYFWVALLVARSISGICSVPLHPGAAHAIAHYVPVPKQVTANGLVTAGALLGIALCYPVSGWMNDHLGWPFSFAIGGGLLFLLGLVWQLAIGPAVRSRTDRSRDRSRTGMEGTVSDLRPERPKQGSEQDGLEKPVMPVHVNWLREPNIWLLTFSYAAYGYFQYLFFYWMEYYLSDQLHVGTHQSRWLSAVVMLSQGVGMAIGGYAADYLCTKMSVPVARRMIVMLGMGLGATFGLLGVNSSELNLVILCLSLAMACQGLCEGVFWTAITNVAECNRGKSAALMNTGGNFGGLISPVVAPVLAKSLGWPTSIGFACIVLALGGAMWLWISPNPGQAHRTT